MYDNLVMRLRAEAECLDNFPEDSVIMRDAADAIEDLQQQLDDETEYATALVCNVPHWIPVTERLPEMNTSCLLYNKYYGPMVGARIDEMRFRIPGSRFPDTPTHWMPLPEPPKEE